MGGEKKKIHMPQKGRNKLVSRLERAISERTNEGHPEAEKRRCKIVGDAVGAFDNPFAI